MGKTPQYYSSFFPKSSVTCFNGKLYGLRHIGELSPVSISMVTSFILPTSLATFENISVIFTELYKLHFILFLYISIL